MFRITTQTAADGFVLKLEGCLWGPWVDELDACWRTAMKNTEGRRGCVDLSEVLSVDEAGRQLLALMYRSGVGFVAKGCMMPELVREISEAPDVRPSREDQQEGVRHTRESCE